MANTGAARRNGGMTEAALAAMLDGQITDAVSYEGSELSLLRIRALEFMDGQIDVPSEEGKSSVVSHDLADTLHWIMPGLLRVFLASDHIGIYEPTKPQNEEQAKQATDYVNYSFMTDCGGYRVMYGAMYDGLLNGNGIIKHWWDETPQYSVESFTGLSDDQFKFLVADDDVEEVLEHSEYPDPSFTFASASPNPALLASLSAPGSAPTGDGMPPGVGGGQPPAAPQPGAAVPPMGGAGGIPQPSAGTSPAGPTTGGIVGGPAAEAMPMPMVPGAGSSAQQPPNAGNNAAAPQPGMGSPDPLAALGGLMPPMQPPMLHDCKIKRVTATGRLQVQVLPPEEFLIERNATQLDEDHVRFCGHRYLDTRSNLIKAGYDKADVEKMPVSNYLGLSQERLARENVVLTQFNEVDESVEYVEVYECYVLTDYDGDGIAEWRKVVMAGPSGNRSLLANEEWGEDLPFTDLVPEPVPHRWRGRSLYDDVSDLQRIKSVLMRQTLDNLYQSNNPMQVVQDGSVINMDALINRELGANIFVKSPGAIEQLAVPFTAKESFGMLEYLDTVREQRTGVSKQTMGMAADALQNQSATAANLQATAAYTKQETYARNIAEVGMKRLFRKILKLVVKHQDRPRTIRLRGQFMEVDPRGWDADMDLTINTGLGAGSRDRDIQMLSGIKATQEQILMKLGPVNPLCTLVEYRNTLAKLCEASGIKNTEMFFKEITPAVMQQIASAPKPPDPKVQEMQMKAQMEAQKMQMQAQIEQAKLQWMAQHEGAKAQAEFALKQKAAEFDQQQESIRAQRDAQLEQGKIEKATQVEQMQAEADIAVKRHEAEMKAQLQQQKFEHDKQMELLKLWLSAQSKAAELAATHPDDSSGISPDAVSELANQMGGGITPDHIKNAIPAPPPSRLEVSMGQMMDHIGSKLADMVAQIHHHNNARMDRLEAVVAAPTEIIRHPETNRVVGARKVMQ